MSDEDFLTRDDLNAGSTGVETYRFPCQTCGADMRFDPAQQLLLCDHCGHSEKIGQDGGPWTAASQIRELDYQAALRDQLPEAELETTQVMTCPNCGAQVDFEPAIHAKECPFCATPVVTGTGEDRHIKPKALMPFVLDEKAARAAMKSWLGRLWFAPSGLNRYARHGRKMDGIYIPHWTFDAQTRSRYSGLRGIVYYEQRVVVRDGKRETVPVAKVRWTPARGAVQRAFDDVLVLASRSLPKGFGDGLLPWDLSRLVPYNPEYIAGFRAEAYTVEIDEAYNEARSYMDRVIERDVRFDIGGDRQQIHQIDTEVSDVTFKHVLLPVWIAAYRFQGKSYRFLVNGQTGRVQGERPWSAWKIAIAVLLALAAAAIIGYLYAVNQSGGGYYPGTIEFDF
jgi:ribosomal protein S27E